MGWLVENREERLKLSNFCDFKVAKFDQICSHFSNNFFQFHQKKHGNKIEYLETHKKNLLKLTKTASCQSHFDPSQQLGCDETNNTRGKKLKQKKREIQR